MDLPQERIAKLEAQVEGIKEDVAAVKSDIKELHSRITTGNREIVDKITGLQNCLDNKLDENAAKSESGHSKIKAEVKAEIEKITQRVDILEKWRYMIVGGAIALGYFVGHSELITKIFK
jgi:archaellum component FlaC